MTRLLISILACAGAAPAQLQLLVVDGDLERAAGSVVDVGSAPAGDSIDTRFHVRNAGRASVVIQAITLSGAGFSAASAPSLPAGLAAGSLLEFTIRFSPPAFGSYSAILQVESLSVMLRGAASAAPTVIVEQGGLRFTLSSGAAVDFGSAELGSSAFRRFTLENGTNAALTVQTIRASGDFIPLASGPATLGPGELLLLDVEFRPSSTGAAEGILTIDGRTFRLRGSGVDPPLPPLKIIVDPQEVASGSQARVSLEFTSPPRAGATGDLRLELQPAVTLGAADPALLFSGTGGRSISFTVAEGDTRVRFGPSAEAELQTGTTAGTLVLTARAGATTEAISLVIPPAPVKLNSVRAARTTAGVDVTVTGFDNTRTASEITFTFFDPPGAPVGSGPIRVAGAADYRRYFEASSAGGAFQLRASFAIAGNAPQVASVEVDITNSSGVARSERIRF